MQEEKTEALILKSFDYQDRSRILTAYTQTHGLISFILKGAKSASLLALSSPLCRIEALFIKKKSNLFRLEEGSILNPHLFLRNKLQHLKTAGELIKIILHTQMPEKPAPKLYALLLAFLKKIPEFEEVNAFLIAFRLKALMHEGGLSWEHQKLFPIRVTLDEWKVLKKISLSRSFEEIKTVSSSEDLKKKIFSMHF